MAPWGGCEQVRPLPSLHPVEPEAERSQDRRLAYRIQGLPSRTCFPLTSSHLGSVLQPLKTAPPGGDEERQSFVKHFTYKFE